MKRILITLLSIVSVSWLFFSCDQSKSLQELLREESKAIDRFLATNKIKVLDEYPASRVFAENEYFKTSDGLYIHVVDSGGAKVKSYNTVTVRFEYLQYIGSDTTKYYPVLYQPYDFIYGVSATYQPTSGYSPVCTGWVYPLEYVGEHGIVDLIIPSNVGSYVDQQAITPLFYKGITYTSFN
ncbi:MAG: DUF4827 domain-containing protein [Dysgonamonadaceae bacterium]|jgi:hypothetical protein|nr:DUF4827 domain-containing protein [Dysgonamonadaceae bacterium]